MTDAITRYDLPQTRMPTQWYNIQHDLPRPLPPPLHPGTHQPVGPDDLAPLFPMALIMQEVSRDEYIDIPEEVQEIYRLWRPTPLLRALHQRGEIKGDAVKARLREDKRALKRLKAQALYLPLPDCIYRIVDGHPLYPTEADLWGSVHPHDYAPLMLEQITPLLSELIGDRVDVLYAPLGVGQHVDHRIVRDWAENLSQARSDWRLKFYTDFPYMRDEAAIGRALAQQAAPMQPEDSFFGTRALKARLKAMAEYKSQLSSFWKDEDEMAKDTAQTFSRFVGDYAERFWIRKVSR